MSTQIPGPYIEDVIVFLRDHYKEHEIISLGNRINLPEHEYRRSNVLFEEFIRDFLKRVIERDILCKLFYVMKNRHEYYRPMLDQLIDQGNDYLEWDIPSNCGTIHEYYNLFVLETNTMSAFGSFYIGKNRALNTPATASSIKDRIDDLSPEAVRRVISYPALFCLKKPNELKSWDTIAHFGLVTEVIVQSEMIQVNYLLLQKVSQELLDEHREQLGISGNDDYNEFYINEWAVKKADLPKILDSFTIE